jgi:hypothetical protein
MQDGIGKSLDLKFDGGFYPPLFHVISAFWASVFGQTPMFGAMITWILGALIFSVGMMVFIRELLKNYINLPNLSKSVIYFASPILALSFGVFPYELLKIGVLYSYGFAICLTPLSLSTILYFLRIFITKHERNQIITATVLMVLSVIVVFLAQPRGLFNIVILALPFVIISLRNLKKSNMKLFKITVISLACIIIIGIVGVVGYVILKLNPEVLFNFDKWFQASVQLIDLPQAIASWLSTSPWGDEINVSMLVIICAIILINFLRLKECRSHSLLILFGFFGVIYITSSCFSFGFANILGAPWYKNPWRISAIFPIILVPLILIALDAVAKVLSSKIHLNGGTIASILYLFSAVLLVTNSQIYNAGAEVSTFMQIDNPESMLSRQKIEAFDKIHSQIPDNSKILADPFTGAGLDYAYTGQSLIIPIFNPNMNTAPQMMNAVQAINSDPTLLCTNNDVPLYFLDLGDQFPVTDPAASLYAGFHNQEQISDYVKTDKLHQVGQFDSGQESPFILYKVSC